jgi:hypothetical protein
MKPVCVACERFYRPYKNGTFFLEMMPKDGSRRPESGTEDRDAWKPYKLWMGDLWRCGGCGHELIVGAGIVPISEHYKPEFAEMVEAFRATITVNAWRFGWPLVALPTMKGITFMGYITAMSPCINCGAIFSYNPLRVPSIRINGVREPICSSCVARVNPIREKNGLAPIVPLPDAYEACDEGEI